MVQGAACVGNPEVASIVRTKPTYVTTTCSLESSTRGQTRKHANTAPFHGGWWKIAGTTSNTTEEVANGGGYLAQSETRGEH